MKLTGRTALVTGGSRGIGRAVALRLGHAGADVAVSFLRNEDAAREVVAELTDSGHRAIAVQCDVQKADDIARMHASVTAELGAVDILVNNAGSIPRPAKWDSADVDMVEQTINVNLTSVIHAFRLFAPGMVVRRWGRIVNISSTYSYNGSSAVLAYTAAKAGVNAITTAMAAELAPHGVLVNAVAPGNIDTDMTAGAGHEVIEWVLSTTPVGRLGTVDEVADAVCFLVDSNFVCGHTLAVDGGQLLSI